jgi:hypothetical protein
MLRYYDCAAPSAKCDDDGQLSSPGCDDAFEAMNDCMAGKK